MASHNRQGDFGAVAGWHKDALEDVVCGIMPRSTYHVLFDGGIDAGLHVVCKNCLWGNGRRITKIKYRPMISLLVN